MTAPIGAVGAAPRVAAPAAPAATTGTSGAGFGQVLAGGLEKLQQVQSNADDLAVKAATGDLTNVHDYMIASSEASLATQLTAAVRNKAVDAFTEIMRMQA